MCRYVRLCLMLSVLATILKHSLFRPLAIVLQDPTSYMFRIDTT